MAHEHSGLKKKKSLIFKAYLLARKGPNDR